MLVVQVYCILCNLSLRWDLKTSVRHRRKSAPEPMTKTSNIILGEHMSHVIEGTANIPTPGAVADGAPSEFGWIEEKMGELHRTISWKDAFWVASGVPALVLFSIGGIAATVGKPSWLCWTLSVLFGFFQAFVYAEIAGLFPGKSGGASIYGAAAWVRYSKIIAPMSVWSNWLAWTPVLTIGSGIAAGYILTALFPADAVVNTWELTLLDLDSLKEGLHIRINATFIVAAILLLFTFAAQHHGILRTAKIQMILGMAALTPLLIVGLVPLITGDLPKENFTPFVPIAFDDSGAAIDGAWNVAGWTLFIGGIYIASWSSYAFETAVCYTREFRNPKTDTFKAILWAGVLCVATYTLIPLSFQGSLGVAGMLEPGIIDGSGVAAAMSNMVGGGELFKGLLVIMLILSLLLGVMTSMAGSSRTLYQGSVDGWLPKYLSHVNRHGAPTRAMWTDLGFNLMLLMMSDYLFVLAVSNICYLVFIYLNLHAGWIHRLDNAHIERPYRCPNWLMALGVVLAFVNAVMLGGGANVWGAGTLTTGVVALALIVPVFWYRHYVVDGGQFPERMLKDLHVAPGQMSAKRAGMLPYLALAAGVAIVFIANHIFHG